MDGKDKFSFFTRKNIILLGIGSMAAIFALNKAVFFFCRFRGLDCDLHWPVSIFCFRLPSLGQIFFALGVFFLFGLAVRHFSKKSYNILQLIFIAFLLILATNFLQGWEAGFINPITDSCSDDYNMGGNLCQYYHDAVEVGDVKEFMRNFEELQPSLRVHSVTHPPGPILLIYFLFYLFGNIGLISITIALVSIIISVFFFYKILRTELSHETSGYLSFLFILIPAIQIYYLVTVDALIAGLLLSGLYFFIYPKKYLSIIASAVCIFLALFLSFGSLFIIPVILGFDIIKRRNIFRSTAIIFFLAVLYALLYRLSGFNYLNSFRIASMIENPKGFGLIHDTTAYFFTRFEGLLEIGIFYGPFLLVMTVCGLKNMLRIIPSLGIFSYLGLLTLLAMFMAGAFKVGETARICLFIYPYLLFPVAACFKERKISLFERNMILYLVFIQTFFMQLFGFYFW
ncbi:MAG: hypothetical protein JW734_07820 [Candidatus Omnitrophica bacterium]|nr:hypothetical protein [Candidatus Omnitrophota bacterium]